MALKLSIFNTMRAGLQRKRGAFAVGLLAALAWSSTANIARAQEEKRVPEDDRNGEGMDTHLFRPAIDSKGFIGVNGSDILGANDISFGLVLDYGRNIMRVNEDRENFGSESLIE